MRGRVDDVAGDIRQAAPPPPPRGPRAPSPTAVPPSPPPHSRAIENMHSTEIGA